MSRSDRRSGGRDDRRYDDDRRGGGGRDRDDSRARRDHGGSGHTGGRPSNGADRGGTHMGHHGGGAGQRGTNSFNGMAFSESELMTDLPKKKFTGRCRLFVGNLPNEVKEAELKELFTPHGDIAECYLSGKGFAFLRLVIIAFYTRFTFLNMEVEECAPKVVFNGRFVY